MDNNNINNKYRIEKTELGHGNFSRVYSGVDLDTGQKFAIKKISLQQRKVILEKIYDEINIMKSLDHPNIVKYYDVYKDEDYMYIVMEYCNAGTLNDIIKYNANHLGKSKILEVEKNTKYYLNQLKDALNYIRQKGIIHRDIKPMNVLLTKKDLSESIDNSGLNFFFEFNDINNDSENKFHYSNKLTVKLADFGLARSYVDGEIDLMSTICGSPLYMAPELLTNKNYNSKADLWSYGVMMYEMLYGTVPLTGNNFEQLKTNVKHKSIAFPSYGLSTECVDLLKNLLKKDFNLRIEWHYFFNHSWFRTIEKSITESIELSTNSITTSISTPKTSLFSSGSFNQLNSPNKLSNSNLTKMNISDINLNKFGIFNPKKQMDYPCSYPPQDYSNQSTPKAIPTKNSNTSSNRFISTSAPQKVHLDTSKFHKLSYGSFIQFNKKSQLEKKPPMSND
jgi:serine/threonine protein kinase